MSCSTDTARRRHRRLGFLTLGAWLLVFSTLTAAGTPARDPLGHYTLGPGDGVRVVVFGQTDLSGDFNVSTSGTVSLPLIGAVEATGKTPAALASAIAGALSPDYLVDPKVSVEVLQYRPFFILGEVKAPGSYPYAAGINVRSAAALAGGYTYRAKQGHAYITRTVGGQQSREKAAPDAPVLPGDILEIPERFF